MTVLNLDEYSAERLEGELKRRADLLARNLCDYCERGPMTRACKFPDRHGAARSVSSDSSDDAADPKLGLRDRVVKAVIELHHGPMFDATRFGRSWDCDVCLKAINSLSGLLLK